MMGNPPRRNNSKKRTALKRLTTVILRFAFLNSTKGNVGMDGEI
jgi:hypothetical protein